MGRHLPAIVDFEAALELEPRNAHLLALLKTARKEFCDAEGDRAVGILEHRRVKAIDGVGEGTTETTELKGGEATVAVKFNRLAIEESDGSDESSEEEGEEEEEEDESAEPEGGFNRMVIADSDESGSGEEEGATAGAAAGGFIAASAWRGVEAIGGKPSVFMRGAKGLGYYVDAVQVAAAPAAAAEVEVPEGGTTAHSWKLRGNRLLLRGDARGAVDCYTQSLTLQPTQVAAYSNRAQAHLTLKNWSAAERDCSVGLGISSMSKVRRLFFCLLIYILFCLLILFFCLLILFFCLLIYSFVCSSPPR